MNIMELFQFNLDIDLLLFYPIVMSLFKTNIGRNSKYICSIFSGPCDKLKLNSEYRPQTGSNQLSTNSD